MYDKSIIYTQSLVGLLLEITPGLHFMPKGTVIMGVVGTVLVLGGLIGTSMFLRLQAQHHMQQLDTHKRLAVRIVEFLSYFLPSLTSVLFDAKN
eukprot:3046899-Amphidinium_carterae.1